MRSCIQCHRNLLPPGKIKPAKGILAKVPNEAFRERAQKQLSELPAGDKAKVAASLEEDQAKPATIASLEATMAAAMGAPKPAALPFLGDFPGSKGGGAGFPSSPSAPRKISDAEKKQNRELEELQGMLTSSNGRHLAQVAKEDARLTPVSIFKRVSSCLRAKQKFFHNGDLLKKSH